MEGRAQTCFVSLEQRRDAASTLGKVEGSRMRRGQPFGKVHRDWVLWVADFPSRELHRS